MSASLAAESRQSHVTVEHVRGASRITSWRSISPVRLLNPKQHDAFCDVIVSSYGGGMVQGDHCQLALEAGPQTRLFISGQAHGRAYRCTRPEDDVVWEATGTIADGATVISDMPPFVLHGAARARLQQTWQLANTARLLLIESVHCGRLAQGEAYDFEQFSSEVTLIQDGRPIVRDPQTLEANGLSMFDFPVLATVYAVGMDEALLSSALSVAEAQELRPIVHRQPEEPAGFCAGFATDWGFMIRLLARTPAPVEQVLSSLAHQARVGS